MADAIGIRPFLHGDLAEVLDLLRLSLGEPLGLARTEKLFRWKHIDNPFGPSLMLVASEHGRLAGFRAFMRWDLIGPSRHRLRCVRAVDTATHPDFQRRGIFRSLTLSGIELAQSEGMDLIFNTPNAKSGPGYLTMGWRSLGRVGVMLRPGAGIVRRRIGETPWEPGGFQPTPSALTEAAFALARVPAGWRTPRTAEYLRWRFGAHPTARYLLSQTTDGLAIGRAHRRNGRRELVISELGGSHRAAAAIRRGSRPDYTVSWFSARSPERALAARAGMLPLPWVSALTVMVRPLTDLAVDLSWPTWDVSLGDFELL
ncbi:MAG: GNAT family N-acetyltransferase [Acidimicrobiia bacterium]